MARAGMMAGLWVRYKGRSRRWFFRYPSKASFRRCLCTVSALQWVQNSTLYILMQRVQFPGRICAVHAHPYAVLPWYVSMLMQRWQNGSSS